MRFAGMELGVPPTPTLDTRPRKDAVANPINLLSREIEA